MSYAIKHALSEVVWADGTTIDLPPISRSQNGWVYRPPEARYAGSGKSFGKGWQGDAEAKQWLASRIQRAFERKNWELPTNLPKLDRLPGLNGDSVQVGWNHPVFGGVWFSMTYVRNRWHKEEPRQLKLTLTYNVLAEDIANRQVKFHDTMETTKSTNWNGTDEQLVVRYEKFRQDPWGFTIQELLLDQRLVDLIGPTVELPEVDYSGERLTEDIEAWYRMSGNVDLLFDKNAEKAIVQNIETIERLITAFEHLGFEVAVGYEWHDYQHQKQIPTSLKIVTRPNGDKGNEEPHTITISQTGIQIKCGYVQDEQRYVEYEQRKAKAFLADVLADEDDWTITETQL